jgi:hypothetical protein
MKVIALMEDPNVMLAVYDPEANAGNYPTGAVCWTRDPRAALKFANAAEAFVFSQRRSTSTPTRPDGLPNRPLTAFSIVIRDLEAST